MISSFRLIHKKYKTHAFTGEGARLYPGRWNTPDNRVVYSSSSLSLTTLEILVSLDNLSILKNYVFYEIKFDEKYVLPINQDALPKDWLENDEITKGIGDEWILENKYPILKIPSAVISIESNYILNPLHPNFSQISFSNPFDYRLDKRLV